MYVVIFIFVSEFPSMTLSMYMVVGGGVWQKLGVCHKFSSKLIRWQARSHNEANEAVASPKISKKNLPQMKNS